MRTALIERFVSALDSVARRRARIKSPAHLILGEQGEDAAFFYLLRKGYTVTARRWSAGNLSGDVDLIARQGELLCIVEVKTRAERNATPAHAAVGQHKRRILRRLARAYLRQLGRAVPPNVRFDVISVYLSSDRKAEIEHFENAFGWSEQRDRYES
jgi:putative endonuclease